MKKCSLIFFVFLVLVPVALSQPTQRYAEIDIPTRDGKTLAADLYTNEPSIAKPVILIQTPYNKNYYRLTVGLPGQRAPFPYDSACYNYVILDWRGFYGSKNASVPNYDRGLDGFDAVEWIASQTWCNGKVGLWGPSALGHIQFLTAKHHPPHLVCCVPLVKDFQTKYTDYYYGGVFRKEQVESMEKLGFLSVNMILGAPLYNTVWRAVETSSFVAPEINVPMLLISGWFDHYPDDIIRAFLDLRIGSAENVRQKHKLIMGPWEHSSVGKLKQGELTFPKAVDVSDNEATRFFDFYLRGVQNGYEQNPVIMYYQMGADEWRTTDHWYASSSVTTVLYLQVDGSLSFDAPTGSNLSSAIAYDPRDPSPSYGGARFNPFDPSVKVGPLDIRQVVESRSDALVFTTPVMTDDLTIAGSVTARLYVSSDRTDTDFSARLCDVFPDGSSMIMTDGIRRMRFRRTFEQEELMTPGEIYTVDIELQNIALTIKKGHRLRIVLSSSDYPRFEINLNNGGPMYTAGDTLIANNSVFHDAEYPSHLILTALLPSTLVDNKLNSDINFVLEQNYPNPFTSKTYIRFRIEKSSVISLKVYDLLGREISTLVDENLDPGFYQKTFDVNSLSPGTYFYRLSTTSGTVTRLMQKMR